MNTTTSSTRARTRRNPRVTKVEPVESARSAGLRHVTDAGPGLRRVGKPGRFRIVDKDGKPVRDPAMLARIKSLVIPPAWTEVWISAEADGHLQATGRDAKGRKQYRYHPDWRTVRDCTKFGRMVEFGRALPAIRARVAADLKRPGLPREKVLAAVVRLLATTLIRVGNDEYARKNRSFGLSTMRDRHVAVSGGTVRFAFKGKSGVDHEIDLEDRTLARVVKQCRDLPGQELFQYLGADGRPVDIGSDDVNQYLKEASGRDFTAKDFRTWAGTVLASMALQEFEEFDSQAGAKRNLVRAIESVSKRLGNTPSVCRKCYVHPEVIDAYMEGSLAATLEKSAEKALRETLADLSPEEAAVLGLLQQRLARASAGSRN